MLEKPLSAPHGTSLTCKGWPQEAAYRMLLNMVDPDVAKDPEHLIVYGGTGKCARNWDCFWAILRSLQELEDDETLLVQSGKPVGILKTHRQAPRVLISNAMLVPAWANWEYFLELEQKGLVMFGQMTAGSWIFIGTQGILQGTYETFAAVAKARFGDSLAGRWVLSSGLGEMGGAQPLAVTMNDGVMLVIEVDKRAIERRLKTGYLQTWTGDLDEALSLVFNAAKEAKPLSVAMLGNAAEIIPELVKREIYPDVVTDQTSAHDPLNGYIPEGLGPREAQELRSSDPQGYVSKARASIVKHVKAITSMQRRGSIAFEYGNNLRKQAQLGGLEEAFSIPGFVQAYIRPLFCEGRGPFRWVALSGSPDDIYRTDEEIRKMFPENTSLTRWISKAHRQVKLQGLPSRVCWLGLGERARFGKRLNEMVSRGELEAPVVIGRDHLDSGSVASPYRETEGMKDGSDAVADWPILNALLNTASGATWVAVHHGGGVGIGYSIHAGLVVLADGTDESEEKVVRCLSNDPAIGVIRHADAGYEKALETAKRMNLNIPTGPG